MSIVSRFQMLRMVVRFMLTYIGLTLTLYIGLIAKSIHMSTAPKNRLLKNPPYFNEHVYVIGIFLVLFATLIVFIPKSNIASVFAVSEQQQQPNIKGSNIYQTKTITLGKDIKNLVISIPNEGHEDPAQSKGMRVINQPYIPENAIVNVGTTVTWLNADAGHRHSITIVDNNTKSTEFNTGRFNNFNASKPFTFNNAGTFAYTGPSYDRAFPNYKMNGSITVIKQPLATSFNATTSASSLAAGTNNNPDTVVTLMVPSRLLAKTVSDLKSQGFTIDNQYPFLSLRGGGSQSGGERQQVLLILTSSGKSLNQVTSALAQVASTLPYK
jgi:plastocyanin